MDTASTKIGNSELLFQLRGVTVVVDPSDIETMLSRGDFDAVVSSDDTSLTMAAGVSGAIRRAAGDTVLDEAARLLPVSLGDVVTTSAGRLAVRYIFHAVTMDFQHGIRATELTIRSIGRAVFRRSEDLGVKRIAMPAIGTGAAGVLAHDSARWILESLAEHSSQPTNLHEVVFSLPDAGTRQALLSQLHAVLLSGIHAGVLQWPSTRVQAEEATISATPTDDATSMRVPVARPASHALAGDSRPSKPRNWLQRWRSRGSEEETTRTPDQNVTVPGRMLLNWMETPDSRQQATRNVSHRESHGSRPLLNSRYVLLEEIGRGGMGIVYLAWDIVLRQTVAIKTVRPGCGIDGQLVERLRQEASAQIRLGHPGIVRLFNFEPSGGSTGPYLIMEYVPWSTAERWIADAGSQGLPPLAVLHLGTRLCEALASAHAAGVLHLDVKPSNVFVDPAGDQPKLADFGIAASLGPTRPDALVTRLVGTPAYMAPEQTIRGSKVGPWTDVYLLAGTLWELITGHKPTERTRNLSDTSSAAALAVVERGLSASVEERPRDAKMFGSLLAAALHEQTSA